MTPPWRDVGPLGCAHGREGSCRLRGGSDGPESHELRGVEVSGREADLEAGNARGPAVALTELYTLSNCL